MSIPWRYISSEFHKDINIEKCRYGALVFTRDVITIINIPNKAKIVKNR